VIFVALLLWKTGHTLLASVLIPVVCVQVAYGTFEGLFISTISWNIYFFFAQIVILSVFLVTFFFSASYILFREIN